MPAFDVARRWKGRVVLDRTGDKQEEAELYAYYGLPYSGASLVDLDEEDEDAAAQIRGLPPR
jgi:hypothetical protein